LKQPVFKQYISYNISIPEAVRVCKFVALVVYMKEMH